ncbi:MAG: hypothetical protein HQ536_03290 [Parcubacteria group bacterium]|nr:hypothetical protein [Parcubacteria group bacterium]
MSDTNQTVDMELSNFVTSQAIEKFSTDEFTVLETRQVELPENGLRFELAIIKGGHYLIVRTLDPSAIIFAELLVPVGQRNVWRQPSHIYVLDSRDYNVKFKHTIGSFNVSSGAAILDLKLHDESSGIAWLNSAARAVRTDTFLFRSAGEKVRFQHVADGPLAPRSIMVFHARSRVRQLVLCTVHEQVPEPSRIEIFRSKTIINY